MPSERDEAAVLARLCGQPDVEPMQVIYFSADGFRSARTCGERSS